LQVKSNYFLPSGHRNTPIAGPPSQGSIFPGLGEAFPFNHMPQNSLFGPPLSLMPANPAPSIGPLATLDTVGAGAAAATGKSSLFSLDKLTELKGFVDRIGGLDGIIGTMTKAQKLIGSVQQMAPLVKVMMGSFGKKGSDSSKLVNLENDDWKPKKRRRKRKKSRTAGSGRGGGFAKGGRKKRQRRRYNSRR
jgi:hypothetical protein